MITIGEYIAHYQPDIFSRLQIIIKPPRVLQIINDEESPEEFSREIEYLMRHSSYRRVRGGAIKQKN